MSTSKTPDISMPGHAGDTPVCMSSLCWEKTFFFYLKIIPLILDMFLKILIVYAKINKIYLKFVLIY